MSKKLFKLKTKKEENITSYQALRAGDLALCSTKEARELISYEKAVEYNVLPLGVLKLDEEEHITLAAPKDSVDLSSALRFMTGKRIKLIATQKEIIQEAVFKAYQGQDTELIKAADKIKTRELINNPKDDFRSHVNDALSFLTYLVDYAVAKEASDIHLIPLRNGAFVKLRINGKLLDHENAFGSLEALTQIITRIKVISNLDTSNKTKPQEGRFSIPTPAREVDARVSIMPTIHGEKAVIRLIGAQKIFTFNDLALPKPLSQHLQNILATPEGAVILSGPTGSGKSSTLYALIHELANTGLSLVSIEDPVEHISDIVSQTSIDPKRGLDYPACLKSVLRQDPDVILLGEIRDEESAKTAFDCATSGHLLLTTVHAKNVFEVLIRLSRLGVDALSLSQSVQAILSQRLVPKLCARCKVIDLAATNQFKATIYKPVGCSACDYSGYAGRVLIVEGLCIDDHIRGALAQNQLIGEELLSSSNYSCFKTHLIDKLRRGEISASNINI